MRIIGHGIDIVETARLDKMIQQHGQHFLDRVFTAQEQAYCLASKKRSLEHFAGRFAVKEAVLKAIGTGWRGGIAWTDIGVVRATSGEPTLVLSGEVARIARDKGIVEWKISISHIATHAVASAIGTGRDESAL